MKNYRNIIEQIVAAGLDAYPCRDPQGATLLVNKQKKRIYICFYATDTIPSLLSIGPVLLNPENGQPRDMGSEYGIFINENDKTAQAHFRGFMKSVIADIEEMHRKDPVLPLFEAKETTKEYIGQVAQRLGYQLE